MPTGGETLLIDTPTHADKSLNPPLHRENPILPENMGLGSTLTVSASRHKLAAVRVCTVPRFVQKQTGDTSLRAFAASALPLSQLRRTI